MRSDLLTRLPVFAMYADGSLLAPGRVEGVNPMVRPLMRLQVPVRYLEDDPIPPATGDLDEDEDVDLDDLEGFAECMAGMNTTPDPYLLGVTTCEVECLNAFDFDNDRDVDLWDFAEFQVSFGG